MTTATANQTASYKGRQYKLLWIGQTKFGRRAKLGFFDGSKEFWVDAALVSISQASGRSRRRVSSDCCRECGGPLVSAPHHAAMGGLCGHCAFDEYDC